jgi:hypothetical protein
MPWLAQISTAFNTFKNFNGKLYTGVQIGRGHHRRYDEGDWKETKITPDLWEISYADDEGILFVEDSSQMSFIHKLTKT